MNKKVYYTIVSILTVAIIVFSFKIFTLFFFNDLKSVAPNLVGMSATEASIKYAPQNISVVSGGEDYSEYPEGVIFSQSPEPGKEIKQNSKITVLVSKGSKKLVVPDFTGMDISAAKAAAEKAGIEISEISRTHHEFELEQVVASEPSKGTVLENSNKVSLLLSLKKSVKTVTMPDLTGIPLTEVQDKLTANELVLGEVTQVSDPNIENDVVIDSNPSAGQAVPTGTIVNISVNKVE